MNFVFSEAATSFDVSDVTPTNGTITGFPTTDSSDYSATSTATNGVAGTGSVSVAAGSYTDFAGGDGAGSDKVTLTG